MNYMNLNKNLKPNQGANFYHGNAIVLNILNAGLNVNTGRGRVNWLGFYVGGGDNNATWWRSRVRNGHKLNRAIVLTVVWDFDPLVSTEQKCYIWTEEVLFGKWLWQVDIYNRTADSQKGLYKRRHSLALHRQNVTMCKHEIFWLWRPLFDVKRARVNFKSGKATLRLDHPKVNTYFHESALLRDFWPRCRFDVGSDSYCLDATLTFV